MSSESKTLVITGFTSEIAKSFLELACARTNNLKILRCGRNPDSDFRVDFSSAKQTREFIDWLAKTRPDYLFLNHGVLPGKRLSETADAVIDESVNVNLISYAMVIEALPSFVALRTVVMSSISGKAGSFDTLYAACKAGVDVTIRKVASTLRPNSRLNAVSPGIISDAGMTIVRKDFDVLEVKRNQTPTKSFSTSREVANLVHFLLFEADNIQGENINLNGGIFIP
jgi:3-oxoacyl-[acyl-carrier protein] reductase